MMTVALARVLFGYSDRVVNILLEKAEALGEAELAAPSGFAHGSARDIFFHLLRAQDSWRGALLSGKQGSGLKSEDFATVAQFRAGLAADRAGWAGYLAGLSDADVAADITLTNWRGEPWTQPLWKILQHLNLHAMQHHAELAQILTNHGQSPGNLDFAFLAPEA
jgi:uncharacterized damage-inducible protein DinB